MDAAEVLTPAADEPTAAPAAAPAAEQRLRAAADEIFERTSPYEGIGLRNHCRRLHRFASALLRQRGLQLDDGVAYLVAMVHDLGIVSEQDEGVNYLHRSRALFHREAERLPLPPLDMKVIDECLVYNHRVLSVPNLSAEAECFRNAVMIEHSRGLVRFGLPRDYVRETFDALPRGNFDRVLMDFTWRTIKREPLTIVRGIFF
ncbi:MAG: hypothetical protein IPH07_26665 [Deltaproteobacteria bacterium]|nr:hypothetical protein [Deltaproteobacteria bacterium]MBK8240378.1 hypothetical protein [Deltaproteobacteria bacterium]MBP7291012.1 hypothetical protein [Nannocystaceae bacterium]